MGVAGATLVEVVVDVEVVVLVLATVVVEVVVVGHDRWVFVVVVCAGTFGLPSPVVSGARPTVVVAFVAGPPARLAPLGTDDLGGLEASVVGGDAVLDDNAPGWAGCNPVVAMEPDAVELVSGTGWAPDWVGEARTSQVPVSPENPLDTTTAKRIMTMPAPAMKPVRF